MLPVLRKHSLLIGKCYRKVISIKYLHTMKLNSTQMDCVLNPGVKQLSSIFTKHGYEIRVAGGAVRDLLMGITPKDLDFATTATPEEMKEMFDLEGVRMINTGGEKHGTVTARIEEENFECTTLRIDVETDGRHAEVEFTKDWLLDANRRDLTINAMFLGLDGTVYDYFDGSKHLQEKSLLFVGDSDTRIKEDYLRILRYFRFYGRIASGPDNHNPEMLESIKRNVHGLGKISGERIWVEVKKIVTCSFGGDLIVKMVECGIGPYIGLPESYDCSNVKCIFKRCEDSGIPLSDIHHMTLLASGFSSEEECINFIARIKCSKREREILFFVMEHRHKALQAETVKEMQDLAVDMKIGEGRNKDIVLQYVSEVLKYASRVDLLEHFTDWDIPKFPVNGMMVSEKGIPRKQIKFALRDLVDEWKKSNFSLGQ
ncbi:CCA tRNA nucleotidyltransferase 1, mitochondrial [Halocaridina rubra]|uniref:CCA tRNA nucleotidyltransferase 1, mitochondrial n=1 Tax=Halocaridina rubra TaxID=373956 RepID=A0AAN8ZP25_HALRR